jgi:hypothetical protein
MSQDVGIEDATGMGHVYLLQTESSLISRDGSTETVQQNSIAQKQLQEHLKAGYCVHSLIF